MNTIMKPIKLILIFIALISGLSEIHAAHIIGGDFYYTCLGNGEYRFNLILYRDCAGNGALFDSDPLAGITATVTVYREDRVQPFYRSIDLRAPRIEDVNPEVENPCLIIPPNICVQKGEYTFDLSLPPSDFAYQIVYQRCCRNNTISNINNPGGTGATFVLELTPQAQEVCNSTIQFNNFPPVVICQGEPLDFDHSAFDPDMDSTVTIEYEFCAPLNGGGLAGSGAGGGRATDPNGVAPDPDTRPPYQTVNFVGGDFTALTPLGGDPVVSIDRTTGLITGTPTGLGQYVVGVCATELDSNGNVLSVIRRDFQFNVARCESKVTAAIDASVDDGQEFIINSCGPNVIDFINLSTQERFINRYRWVFDINGQEEVSAQRNPTITFPGRGRYEGILIINEGTACSDSADIVVNVLGAIEADFSYEYDTCTAGPVLFQATDSTGNGFMEERIWDFGQNQRAEGLQATNEFRQPGDRLVIYYARDTAGCQVEVLKEIPYYPIPNEILVEPIFVNNCVPVEVFFKNESYPINSTYIVNWDFGDGGTSTRFSPTHIYEAPGNYTVGIEIISPIGCEYRGTLQAPISVIPSPIADFTYNPSVLNQFNTDVNFIDLSARASQWQWLFSEEGQSTFQNPTYNFMDTGLMDVTLIVTHSNGCKDTTSQVLDIVPSPTYFLPNAFSPNDDGVNDVYQGQGDLIGIRDFNMKIFNRYGQLVFETEEPDIGWNGRFQNVGSVLEQGVYVCKVRFTGPRGKSYEMSEFATLLAK